jgi:hypothetical protein
MKPMSLHRDNFWDYARSKPQDTDLIGTYRGTLVGESKIADATGLGDITLILETNGAGQVSALPVFDTGGRKLISSISGDVVWRVSKPFNPNGEEWWLEMTLLAQNSVIGAVKEMLVLERCPPHRFFMIVGDPDDYVGVEFKRLANQRQ